MVRKCPSCHLVFQAKEVKRELLGADTLVQKDYLAPAPMKWEWQDNFDKETHVHTKKDHEKAIKRSFPARRNAFGRGQL